MIQKQDYIIYKVDIIMLIGAAIDITGVGVGFGAGLVIESGGAALVATVGAPAVVVTGGVLAVGFGVGMAIDYGSSVIKDWYYRRD